MTWSTPQSVDVLNEQGAGWVFDHAYQTERPVGIAIRLRSILPVDREHLYRWVHLVGSGPYGEVIAEPLPAGHPVLQRLAFHGTAVGS